MKAVVVAATVFTFTACLALGQTRPTLPSAAPTIPSLPTQATKPNSPCQPTQFEPCSSANMPAGVSTNVPASSLGRPHVLTADQARGQIEAAGYLNVTELQNDAKGNWRANAVKEGKPVKVTVDPAGVVRP